MANSFVQQRNSNGTGNSISLAFSSNNAAGNLLVAQVASAGTSLAGASVSDTNNGSYAQDDSDAISGAPVATYHFGNCAAGANTVTFSQTASGGFIEIVILEFSGGGNTTWAKRTAAHNNGSGTSASPGAMTVVSGDVCVSYAQFLTAPPTGGASGWTYTETAAANGTQYLIASGTSVTGSFACNSTAWVAGSVAFDSSSSSTVNMSAAITAQATVTAKMYALIKSVISGKAAVTPKMVALLNAGISSHATASAKVDMLLNCAIAAKSAVTPQMFADLSSHIASASIVHASLVQTQALASNIRGRASTSATLSNSSTPFSVFTNDEVHSLYYGCQILILKYLQFQWWNSYYTALNLEQELRQELTNRGIAIPDTKWVPAPF